MTARVIQGSFLNGRPKLAAMVQAKIVPPPAIQAQTAAHPAGPPPAFTGQARPVASSGPQPSAFTARPSEPPTPSFAPPWGAVQRHVASGAFAIDTGRLGLASAGGRPLPEAVRGKMEAAFGADFSNVRVHVGPQAERMGAIAFTIGSDVYFAPGRYQPETLHGRQLLGHELAHVVQQRQGRVKNPLGSGLAVVQDHALEAEADRLGRHAAMHRVVSQAKMAPRTAPLSSILDTGEPPRVQRQPSHNTPPRKPEIQALVSSDIVQRTPASGFPVNDEMRRKLVCAQGAIDYARPFITHGPQNQGWARVEHGEEGDVNMSAMIGLVNAQWPGGGGSSGYDLNWVKPRRIGAAVAATGGGNCQDIAALAYNYLREHADPTWTVCFVVANTIHHAFATIGDPRHDTYQTIAVADAWVRYPRACRFSEHFCQGDGNLAVLKSKPGGKAGRTGALISKYWDPVALPGYVTNLKGQIRLQPRAPSTWNHEDAVGRYERRAGVFADIPGATGRRSNRTLRAHVTAALQDYHRSRSEEFFTWQSGASRDAIAVITNLQDHARLFTAVHYYLDPQQPKPPAHIITVGEKLKIGSRLYDGLLTEYNSWART